MAARGAAGGAEVMARHFGVEGVSRGIIRRDEHAETIARRDPVRIALLRADRAIAFAHALGPFVDLEGDPSAMASAARNFRR